MTIHDKIQGLYQSIDSFPIGTLVRLEYLPTDRSRKWRKSSLSARWAEGRLDEMLALLHQEKWAYARWVRDDRPAC